ncbi:hypothetical protein FB382_000149 [Nocardioides ginsengisegetis]|uniref:DUF4012 domain-containing protein n=1 Tax=Nocardioides ginsengisegetis TaxID=661491 RepID=A0A7W3IWF4_9ACTN|nr:hypothetical protein [Nocardioides ginsengisegetis]
MLVAVVFGAWCGVRLWQVRSALLDTQAAAARLQSAVQDGDEPAQHAVLDDLTSSADRATTITDGPTWAFLEHLPFLGDDARGVGVVSSVASRLARDGVEPLIASAGHLDTLVPKGGHIPVEPLVRLQEPTAAARDAFVLADQDLAGQDSSGFTAAVAGPYRQLVSQVDSAASALDSVSRALDVLPGMLGQDGPRHYLLVVQNNAEIRATGGLPGSVTLLEAQDGKVRLTRQVAGSAFGQTATPVLPLTPAEQAIYGPQLGTYFLDANFTPDFPRTAALMKARWEQAFPGAVDGVLSLDPVALSYLLEATGPVAVGGVSLNADNAVDQLLHQVYLRFSDPADQDLFFRQVARAVFSRVAAGDLDPQTLVSALVRGADEHRIYVHSFTNQEQQRLVGSEVAGDVDSTSTTIPRMGIYLNDGTGAKMSYFLRYRARVESTYCQSGVQGLSGHLVLRSAAPLDAASLPDYVTGGGAFGTPRGSQLVDVALYAPVGGDFGSIQLNGEPVASPSVILLGDRPVAHLAVELAPEESVDVEWRARTGAGQSGDVAVDVTPSVEARQSSFTAASACGPAA